ncbi:hypothetical protein [Nostoc sp. NMS8]|uniref:hypothetical protein n=1 Tax=Nostoc sp. NMS8 TaxID=2815392 RepID=UPI0025FA23B4|nr:hypothetical protein [Nostoc sp. NMS8]MBN3962104.1 hypothetical protein [Nostoc sp. NMS8]
MRSHFFFSERSPLALHLSLESLDTTSFKLRSHFFLVSDVYDGLRLRLTLYI